MNGQIYLTRTGKGYSPSLVLAAMIRLTIGYLSIFLVGIDIGNLILPALPPPLLNIQSPRTRTFAWLILSSVVSIAMLQLTGIYTKIPVSRRFVSISVMASTNNRQISRTCSGQFRTTLASFSDISRCRRYSFRMQILHMSMLSPGHWMHLIATVWQSFYW